MGDKITCTRREVKIFDVHSAVHKTLKQKSFKINNMSNKSFEHSFFSVGTQSTYRSIFIFNPCIHPLSASFS